MARKAREVCIVCQKEKPGGYPVEEDPVLQSIRAAKTRLGMAQGNTLVVCKADLATAAQKRARFEKYLMWYGLLGAGFLLLSVLVSRSLASIALGLVGAAFVLLLSVAVYYPKVSAPPAAGKPAAKVEARGRGKR